MLKLLLPVDIEIRDFKEKLFNNFYFVDFDY